MKILAVATATSSLGVAYVDGSDVLWEQTIIGKGNSEKLPELVQPVISTFNLPEALDGIAVVQGPGTYSGLRIGISFAKSLAQAWNLPLIGISTMQALAAGVGSYQGSLLTLLAACREDWNVALFSDGSFFPPKRLTPDFVIAKDQLLRFIRSVRGPLAIQSVPYRDWRSEVVGEGSECKLKLLPPTHSFLIPRQVAYLGLHALQTETTLDLMKIVPVYSHLPNITTPRSSPLSLK